MGGVEPSTVDEDNEEDGGQIGPLPGHDAMAEVKGHIRQRGAEQQVHQRGNPSVYAEQAEGEKENVVDAWGVELEEVAVNAQPFAHALAIENEKPVVGDDQVWDAAQGEQIEEQITWDRKQ